MGVARQDEIEHAVGLVGRCPHCGALDHAELWRDPSDPFTPYQVRCGLCGARGPRCDCGYESAVVAWRRIVLVKDPPAEVAPG